MSQSNPNPEEKQRMVDAAVKAMSPQHKPKPETELDQLVKAKEHAKQQVRFTMRPIIDQLLLLPSTSPHSPHNATGRMSLIMQTQRQYLDHFRTLSKEEVLFLLSFAYAERTIEDFV